MATFERIDFWRHDVIFYISEIENEGILHKRIKSNLWPECQQLFGCQCSRIGESTQGIKETSHCFLIELPDQKYYLHKRLYK